MKRTNLFLLAAALGLFAYVVLVDRMGLSTGELEERKDRLVPELVRDRLVTIGVERDGSRYSLARGERDADGNVRFAFATPIHADADSERVAEALSTIEWAEPVRTLEGSDASDRRRYGLDRPRLRLRFEVAGETVTLAFGRNDPTGAGVYASVGSGVFVVATETRDAFDHAMEFFRVRRLATVPSDVARIRIAQASGELRLERTNGVFRMTAPMDGLASEGRVNVALATLRTLEASRFVDESPQDLARFGLTSPRLTVEVGGASNAAALRIIVGSPCDAPPRSSYVRAGNGPVVCVDDGDLEPLFVGPDAYRELRASATEPGGVTGVDLSDGHATLSVRDEDGSLRFTMGGSNGDADSESFEEWIEGLRNTRASSTLPLAAESSFTPTTTLTVHRTGTRADDVIRFQATPDAILGRRGDDATLLVFPRSLAERLEVTTRHVRSRSLLHEDPSTLSRLEVTRVSGTESLGLVEGDLRIVAPIAIAAETARVAELSARLAGLEAVRYVSDSIRPEHGLDRPRFDVRFAFGSGASTTHRLRVGAAVDGDSAYAALDDSAAVFVLVGATVELLATPLASRQELATESLYVDGVTVRHDSKTVALVRDGPHFKLGEVAIDDAVANRAISAIADMRASEIAGYGAPRPESGLARPTAEIRIRRGAEAGAPSEVVLSIGASIGDGDARRTFVRRADRNVVYLVPTSALAPILALAD